MYCILMFYNDSQATENDLEPKKKKKTNANDKHGFNNRC